MYDQKQRGGGVRTIITTTTTITTIILLRSRLDIFLLGDTLQFKVPTPLGGMALAPQSNADLPYPRNPPYEVRTPHLHGGPAREDTTLAQSCGCRLYPRTTFFRRRQRTH